MSYAAWLESDAGEPINRGSEMLGDDHCNESLRWAHSAFG